MTPTRAKRPCARMGQGCPHLQPCPVHGVRASDYGRASASARGYGTHHKLWRLMILRRDPICADCGGPGHDDDHADHIVPLRAWTGTEILARVSLSLILTARGMTFDSDELGAWSLLNGQRLCARCHAKKTRGEHDHGA